MYQKHLNRAFIGITNRLLPKSLNSHRVVGEDDYGWLSIPSSEAVYNLDKHIIDKDPVWADG